MTTRAVPGQSAGPEGVFFSRIFLRSRVKFYDWDLRKAEQVKSPVPGIQHSLQLPYSILLL